MTKEYYENESNVESYCKFTPSHDGSLLVDALGEHLKPDASVLELGIGPGKDLQLLSEQFQVTGSDYSKAFLQRFRQQHPEVDLLELDALTLDTELRFDAIFSNKVLMHFDSDELRQSFANQHRVLNEGGIVLHSLWYGEGQQEFDGLTLVYHNEQDLTELLQDAFDILAMEKHAKMADGDSIYVIARKK